MYSIEHFRIDIGSSTFACIDNCWVVARPINYTTRTLWERLAQAYAVFTGKAEAITFYKQ